MIARVSHGFARGVFISVSGPAGLRRPAMLGSLSLPCLPWLPEPTTAGRVTARYHDGASNVLLATHDAETSEFANLTTVVLGPTSSDGQECFGSLHIGVT
jgi:hypothetical protein